MTKEQIFQMLDKALVYIHQNFSEEDNNIYEQLARSPDFTLSYSVESGISKAVILMQGMPFVIKLPFYCLYDEDYYSDAHYEWREAFDNYVEEKLGPNTVASREELCRLKSEFIEEYPEPEAENYFSELEGADYVNLPRADETEGWDYCRLECIIYDEAVKRGLGAYFAEEGFLGRLHCGHPVYYQQRCVPFGSLEHNYNDEVTEKRQTSARDTCDRMHMYCFNPLWIADFIERYGTDELARLNDFLNEMQIGDLRECNIGYLDDAPILFDYSGFRHWD